MVDEATKLSVWDDIAARHNSLAKVKALAIERPSECVRRRKLLAPTTEKAAPSGCCATALDRLYNRHIELAAAESVLADYIDQGAPQATIDYLADIVLCFQCRVDELTEIRDAEC